ncbi:MAG: hypothetical protein LUD29_06075 [Clostridia bacterium]|nr:hypothetical protein [Clostridia bacterium]
MGRPNRFSELKDAVCDFINEYQSVNGKMPTYHEVAEETGCSVSSAARAVKELMDEGRIARSKNNYLPSFVNIKNAEDNMDVTPVKVLGTVICGSPEIIDDGADEDTVYLPAKIFGRDNMFITRATGYSMVGRGIYPDDLLVVYTTHVPYSDMTVLASLEDGCTCKILMRDRDGYFLRAANDEVDEKGNRVYPDIRPAPGERFEILGTVEYVMHDPNHRHRYY